SASAEPPANKTAKSPEPGPRRWWTQSKAVTHDSGRGRFFRQDAQDRTGKRWKRFRLSSCLLLSLFRYGEEGSHTEAQRREGGERKCSVPPLLSVTWCLCVKTIFEEFSTGYTGGNRIE